MTRVRATEVAPLWTVEDAAAYLGVAPKTLINWRALRQGPTGMRVGRYVRFRPEAVIAWAQAREDAGDGAA